MAVLKPSEQRQQQAVTDAHHAEHTEHTRADRLSKTPMTPATATTDSTTIETASDKHEQLLFPDMLNSMGPATAYVLGHHSPLAGESSPSNAPPNSSPLSTNDCLVLENLLFPSLATENDNRDAYVDAVTAASSLQIPNATADATIDGWLQQYVNTDALDHIAQLNGSSPSNGFTLGNTCPGSVLMVDASPQFSYASPEYSPPTASVDLLDQSVAAIAAAMAEPLSSDMLLAEMFSSADIHSIVAPTDLLPLTGLATPLTNIAPQKTLSSTTGSSPMQPMAKRVKRQASVAVAGNDINSFGVLDSNKTAVASKQVTASMASKVPRGSAYRSNSHTVSANASNNANGARLLAPSPPRPSNGTGVSRSIAPLAPRQQQQQQQQKKLAPVKQELAPRSGSGSNTPPGLSVLAKTAQNQTPIQVKPEPPTTTSTQKLRPIAQAPVAANPPVNATPIGSRSPTDYPRQSSPETTADTAQQKRQERLIKNRAAALLSRKRKREYMTRLEADVEELRESNSELVKRLLDMEKRLGELTAERDQLRRQTHAVHANPASSQPTATTTTNDNNANSNKASEKTEQKEQQQQQNKQEQTKQCSDSMEVDDGNENSESKSDGLSGLNAPLKLASSVPERTNESDASTEEVKRADHRGRTVRPRVPTPAGAPKTKQAVESQPQSHSNNKPRAAGALLMAMLFSFSLFTLPSLYNNDSQISTGGSAGILPVRTLPQPSEPRLLISDSDSSGHGTQLIERVRRSISALAQQIDGSRQASESAAAVNNSSSRVETNNVRPMTMEESIGLRAWINTGLTAGAVDQTVDSHVGDLSAAEGSATPTSSLSLVRHDESTSGKRRVEDGVNRVARPLDYAMLYCPTMQHVLFGGDKLIDMPFVSPDHPNMAKPRVIHADKYSEPKSFTSFNEQLNDVDDRVSHSANTPQTLDLAPTLAAAAAASKHVLRNSRPKMSFYSPVAVGGGSGDSILAPWEEYARMADTDEQYVSGADGSGRQKYLRIDVEVVGSRWVTADKFAHGLY
ncbi:hypothetical protein H4R99_001686 [Coemansia sp. RSA 1722]|nr:hypothetical protein LPJ57_001443 [Coemansia sp. RSA 486]KAJ2237966.1 hypothetical protein IWW45_000440 [Coemansia sp. RSA 485]KAJ2604613.1 hypothetical protein H4R99_001686 [Coemansia sp. RSA 1722]